MTLNMRELNSDFLTFAGATFDFTLCQLRFKIILSLAQADESTFVTFFIVPSE